MLPSSSPLLTKQSLEVSSRGELVILRIGNVELPMHYEQAMDVSRWVREEGAVLKRLSGRGRTLRSLGILHDADAKAKPLPRGHNGTAIHVKTKLQTWRREDVKSEGRLVAIKIVSKTFKLHFENALKVAQWLRIRAKEAMRTADDTKRKWFEVGNLEGIDNTLRLS